MKPIALKILGYLLVLAGLYWIFHDISWRSLVHAVPHFNFVYAIIGVALTALSYFAQGQRWTSMAGKDANGHSNISVTQSTKAIYIGLFSNEVLPFKGGEAVRAYLFSRWGNISMKNSVLLAAFERLLDATLFLFVLAIFTLTLGAPAGTVKQEKILLLILAAIVVVAVAVLIFMARFHAKMFERIRQAVAIIPHRIIPTLYIWTAIYFILQGTGIYFLLLACGIHIPIWTALAVYTIVHVGTAFPLAPSNIGSYQFFQVVALTFFGVDKTLAAGFSILGFILVSAPMWIGGLIALSLSDISWQKIKSEIVIMIKRKESPSV